MSEINLLDRYPAAKRNLEERAQVAAADRVLARQFGREYFDGTRDQGYGGYRYDGRWAPVVNRFKTHYGLADNAAILDVGCAKGFMLHDFKAILPAATLSGLDISRYAIENAMDDIKHTLCIGNARALPYADNAFDLVISINTVHNLARPECVQALREIQRVSRKHAFITVDAWRTDAEKERMQQWNLTAQTYMHVDDWQQLFSEAGYTGDYYWFIP